MKTFTLKATRPFCNSNHWFLKKVFFTILVLTMAFPHLQGQCSVRVEAGSLQIVDEGDCNYHIRVRTAKTNGNPSARIFWGCGYDSTVATIPSICISGWTSNNVFKSDSTGTITCGCDSNLYAKIEGYANNSCGGAPCNVTFIKNLAITLSDFKLSASNNKNEVCLNWQLKNPDLANQYLVESSLDGLHFDTYGLFNNQSTYKSKERFGICLDNKMKHSYFRLQVLEPDGSVTLSPTRKIDLLKSSYSVSVDQVNHRLKIFGMEHYTGSPYEIVNSFGQLIEKGILTSSYIQLPELTKGMYVLKLQLAGSEKSIPWIY